MAASLARPKDPACGWATTNGNDAEIALTQGGKPFASVGPGPAISLALPSGAGSHGLWLEASHRGSRVAGWMSTAPLPLYPARAIAFGPNVFAEPDTTLELIDAAPGKVVVGLDRKADVHFTRPPKATVPCDGFAWSRQSFDPRKAAGLPPWNAAHERSLPGHSVSLRTSPGGPVFVTYTVPFAVSVEVVGRKDHAARVLIDTGDVLLVGWLSARMSGALSAIYGMGGLGTRGRGAGGAGSRPRYLRCTRAIPLVVVRGTSAPVTAGTIAAGTELRIVSSSGPRRAYVLPWLAPEDGVRFVVPDGATCTDVPPPAQRRINPR